MDPVKRSVARFSVFAFAACLLAAVFVGPLAIVVWVVATLGLVGFGRALSDRRPPR